jgi:hypothetical protein
MRLLCCLRGLIDRLPKVTYTIKITDARIHNRTNDSEVPPHEILYFVDEDSVENLGKPARGLTTRLLVDSRGELRQVIRVGPVVLLCHIVHRIAFAIDLLLTARGIESLAIPSSAKMGICGVEDDSGNSLRHDAALVGPHHVFQQKGEPALHRDIVGWTLLRRQICRTSSN